MAEPGSVSTGSSTGKSSAASPQTELQEIWRRKYFSEPSHKSPATCGESVAPLDTFRPLDATRAPCRPRSAAGAAPLPHQAPIASGIAVAGQGLVQSHRPRGLGDLRHPGDASGVDWQTHGGDAATLQSALGGFQKVDAGTVNPMIPVLAPSALESRSLTAPPHQGHPGKIRDKAREQGGKASSNPGSVQHTYSVGPEGVDSSSSHVAAAQQLQVCRSPQALQAPDLLPDVSLPAADDESSDSSSGEQTIAKVDQGGQTDWKESSSLLRRRPLDAEEPQERLGYRRPAPNRRRCPEARLPSATLPDPNSTDGMRAGKDQSGIQEATGVTLHMQTLVSKTSSGASKVEQRSRDAHSREQTLGLPLVAACASPNGPVSRDEDSHRIKKAVDTPKMVDLEGRPNVRALFQQERRGHRSRQARRMTAAEISHLLDGSSWPANDDSSSSDHSERGEVEPRAARIQGNAWMPSRLPQKRAVTVAPLAPVQKHSGDAAGRGDATLESKNNKTKRLGGKRCVDLLNLAPVCDRPDCHSRVCDHVQRPLPHFLHTFSSDDESDLSQGKCHGAKSTRSKTYACDKTEPTQPSKGSGACFSGVPQLAFALPKTSRRAAVAPLEDMKKPSATSTPASSRAQRAQPAQDHWQLGPASSATRPASRSGPSQQTKELLSHGSVRKTAWGA